MCGLREGVHNGHDGMNIASWLQIDICFGLDRSMLRLWCMLSFASLVTLYILTTQEPVPLELINWSTGRS